MNLTAGYSGYSSHSGFTSEREPSGVISDFEIVFSDRSNTYMEGQEVKGEVMIELVEDIVIERLDLEFSGIAEVRWETEENRSRGSASSNMTSMTIAADQENYLNQNVSLYARDESSHNFMVRRGRHVYPFRIQLPFSVPSTFAGKHGSVKYHAQATLVRPWQSEESTSKEFKVKSAVDLNTISQAYRPISSELYRPHSCLCFVIGHISAYWRLERVGYLPGESIRITGEIHNNSKIRVKKSKAFLVQHVRYYDKSGKSLHTKNEVIGMSRGEVLPGRSDIWREDLLIPSHIPPTGLKGCTLMDLWYTLKLKVAPAGPLEKLTTSTDIIIASVGRGQNALDGYGNSNPGVSDNVLDLNGYFF